MGASRESKRELIRLAALTAFWSLSLFFMVMGTFEPKGWWRWLAWGLWFSVPACLCSVWWILDHMWQQRKNSVEHMADILTRVDERSGNVRPMR